MGITSPPKNDEFELSLFGPGIGECVVVHLGDGNWMVVDSCLDESGTKSVAQAYLESIGVEISRQLKLIVVTHWHDDHIRGMGQLVREARSALFACSSALRAEEFCTCVGVDKHVRLVSHTSGVTEFGEILEALRERRPGQSGPDIWASDGTCLYVGENNVHVIAVSPSAQTISDSHTELAKLIPSLNGAICRLPCVTPNATSVAILLQLDTVNLLLGADLEASKDNLRGWGAVVVSPVRPKDRSAAYKVAHHGSENANIEEIWTELVSDDVIAVLTPYARGPKPLPSSADVKRIKKTAKTLYCTAWPVQMNPPRRKGVDKILNQVARKRWAVRKNPGHVRLRGAASAFSAALVELFNGARTL